MSSSGSWKGSEGSHKAVSHTPITAADKDTYYPLAYRSANEEAGCMLRLYVRARGPPVLREPRDCRWGYFHGYFCPGGRISPARTALSRNPHRSPATLGLKVSSLQCRHGHGLPAGSTALLPAAIRAPPRTAGSAGGTRGHQPSCGHPERLKR